jgi:hypothetical protein
MFFLGRHRLGMSGFLVIAIILGFSSGAMAESGNVPIFGVDHKVTQSKYHHEGLLKMDLHQSDADSKTSKVTGIYGKNTKFTVETVQGSKSKTTLYLSGKKITFAYNMKSKKPTTSIVDPDAKEQGVTNLTAQNMKDINGLTGALLKHADQHKHKKLKPEMLVGKPENSLFQITSMLGHFHKGGGHIQNIPKKHPTNLPKGFRGSTGAGESLSSDSCNEMSLSIPLPIERMKFYCPGSCVEWDEDKYGKCEGGWCKPNTYKTTGESNCHGRCGAGCDEFPYCIGNKYTAACVIHDGTGSKLALTIAANDCTAIIVSGKGCNIK